MPSAELTLTARPHSAPDWNTYVARHAGASVWHKSEWGDRIHDHFGHTPVYIEARTAEGALCGLLPLVQQSSWLFGKRLTSMPYFNYGGVIADSDHVARALVSKACAVASEQKVRSLELRHETTVESDRPLELRSEKLTMILPLEKDSEAQWGLLRSKLRSQIRRPQKAGARAVIGGAELLGDFYRVFELNMRDLGVPVYPLAFFRMVMDNCDFQIVVTYMDETPVAAGFLVRDGARMEIPWASSLRSHNRFSPNMLLYWECIRHAIKIGCREFDFGRCTRDSGTHRFKAQWGAVEHPFAWQYYYPQGHIQRPPNPNQALFQWAMAIWRRVPLAICGWIGPRIVMALP